jgi:hypothetical protein
MPSKTTQKRGISILTTDEKRFIRFYVKEGAVEEKIAYAERRAKLKVGTAKLFLAKKRVQNEIKRQMQPVWDEQRRQELVGDAVLQVTTKLEQDARKAEEEKKSAQNELAAVVSAPLQRIDETVLEDQLMRMAVGLDQNIHPQQKLAAIQAAFVVKGILEQGKTRRVAPGEDDGVINKGPGIYTAVFARLRAEKPVDEPIERPADNNQVFDLVPEKNHDTSKAVVLPAIGEPLESLAAPVQTSRNKVITVDLG